MGKEIQNEREGGIGDDKGGGGLRRMFPTGTSRLIYGLESTLVATSQKPVDVGCGWESQSIYEMNVYTSFDKM